MDQENIDGLGQLLDAQQQDHAPKVLSIASAVGGNGVLVVPRTMKVESVKKYVDENLLEPVRRRGVAKIDTLESLVDLARRFMGPRSVLFADERALTLTAVHEYHDAQSASFCDHVAHYPFPLDPSFEAWTRNVDKWLGMEEFGRFLEDRLLDVLDPADAGPSAKAFGAQYSVAFAGPGKLLELSRGLSIRATSKLTKSVNLQSGEATLNFSEEHADEAGKPLRVPGAFVLALPIFRGGELFQVPARLRYRVSGSTVSWSYALHRADDAKRLAFREGCAKAAAALEVPLYFGRPEIELL